MLANQKSSALRPRRLGIRASLWLLLSLSSVLLLTGCYTAKASKQKGAAVAEGKTASGKVRLEAVGIAFLEPEAKAGPTNSVALPATVTATGCGLPAPHAESETLKRMTAMEAARYRALANLAERVLGQEVTRDAEVFDLAFAGEEVHASLSGELKQAFEVSREYDAEKGVATVTVGLAQGDVADTPAAKNRSRAERVARAEAAARIHAAALLREKIGQIFVKQHIQVENLVMQHQDARIYVQGILEGVQYSTPRWPTPNKCEVTAVVVIDQDKLANLAERTTDGSEPPEAPPKTTP